MTFEPTGIASKFEDAIVQKEPASPVYSEHSFVTYSVSFRGALMLMLKRSSSRPMMPRTSRRASTQQGCILMETMCRLRADHMEMHFSPSATDLHGHSRAARGQGV